MSLFYMSPAEREILGKNCVALDALVALKRYRCSNPLCRIPIDDRPYDLRGYGRLCDLCQEMVEAIIVREGLVNAHSEYENMMARKKRSIEGDR